MAADEGPGLRQRAVRHREQQHGRSAHGAADQQRIVKTQVMPADEDSEKHTQKAAEGRDEFLAVRGRALRRGEEGKQFFRSHRDILASQTRQAKRVAS